MTNREIAAGESTTGPAIESDSKSGFTNTVKNGARVLLASTTRWPSPARLAIELSRAGCEVTAVCRQRNHPLSKTRAVRHILDYWSLFPIESLARAIESTEPDLIIPCDDRAVGHLHELHRRVHRDTGRGQCVAALIERSLGASSSFSAVTSRHDLLTVAQDEGILVPEMKRLASEDRDALSRERPRFPCVIKADGTFAGQGVRIAHNDDQARRALCDIAKLSGARQVIWQIVVNDDPFFLRPWLMHSAPGIIVQAFVEGQPANCGVFCWEGEVLAGIAVEALSTVGATGPATVVRVVDGVDMMSAAAKIARRLRLSGFFGFDFIIEKGSRAHYLIEMNPRCTPVCHLQLGRRRDMIRALQVRLAGERVPERSAVTSNDLIAYFPSARTHAHEFLEWSYEDVPRDEPELIEALLRPAPATGPFRRSASRVLQEWVRLKARHGLPTSRPAH